MLLTIIGGGSLITTGAEAEAAWHLSEEAEYLLSESDKSTEVS
jgi:hypothetical protein